MANKRIKLAEALLRRKELQEKVNILKLIKDKDLYEVKCRRQNVTENIDEVIAQVPKLTASQVTHEFDWHSRRLRMIDAAIQQTNWITDVAVEPTVMADYEPGSQVVPEIETKAAAKVKAKAKTPDK